MNRNEIIIVMTAGFILGAYATYTPLRKKHNELVAKYNRMLALDAIKQRVFEEVMPQLPDDYTLSPRTMNDIQAANIFMDNGM